MGRKGESIHAQLNDKEWLYQKYWVEKLDLRAIGREIGSGGTTVGNALRRNKIGIRSNSEVHKGKKYWLGKHRSEETKRKISETKKGIPLSKERRIEIGKRSKGNKYRLGKHPSKETKEKMSKAQTKYTSVQRKINKAISERVRWTLRGGKEGKHWGNILGYNLSDLMSELEKDFRDGMTWDNYGNVWHIDHIIPLAHFQYASPKDIEFKKAWALGNLQPLLVAENRKKHTNFRFY